MPARRPRLPNYCLHKPSGLAYVRDQGKVRYLGRHGSDESWEAYSQFVDEWRSRRTNATFPEATQKR
ncbi:MAG TPA: hypothetical protein VJL29_12220 [Thermoguttaceae bacterium]|nr:hypothetical protein [Thermoguttaceae bacterium]